jgi:hypothetical protein
MRRRTYHAERRRRPSSDRCLQAYLAKPIDSSELSTVVARLGAGQRLERQRGPEWLRWFEGVPAAGGDGDIRVKAPPP